MGLELEGSKVEGAELVGLLVAGNSVLGVYVNPETVGVRVEGEAVGMAEGVFVGE